MSETSFTTCYRHPKRETYVRCTRCDRFICVDCMRDAAVGHQCVECVREGNKSVRQARTVFGGSVSATTYVTFALIAVNLLVFAAELARPIIIEQFDMVGLMLLGPDGERYVFEDLDGYEVIGVAAGEWYRLITSAFLHLLPQHGGFGLVHLLFNMIWLWKLGGEAERQLGWARYLALYLISAVGGSVAIYLLAPFDSTVGASGAVFGLAAACFVIGRRVGHGVVDNRLMVFFLIWLVISAGFTSWQGHLGGLLAGGGLALALAYTPKDRRTLLHTLTIAGFAVALVALVVMKTGELVSL